MARADGACVLGPIFRGRVTGEVRDPIFYDELRIADQTGSREAVSPPAQTPPGCLGALLKRFHRA